MAVAWRVAGAAALWLIGRWLIAFALGLMGRAFEKQKFDVTLARYIHTALSILLNVALAVAVLGFFGVETTTFAALLAARGVAIGAAWGGLLGNFAAGAFLVFLRPFKVDRLIRETFGEAGFPGPMPMYEISGAFAAAPFETSRR